MRNAKQLGNKALVTDTYECFPIKGDEITFTYCDELRTGIVEYMRPSTVNNGWLIFTNNGMIDTTSDKVWKTKTYLIDWDKWVLGQLAESGVMSFQEVLSENFTHI